MKPEIQKAVEILRSGGIVIFPTDTAFAISCRIDLPESVEKLFNIRKRPFNKAMPVLFSDLEMVREYTEEIPSRVKEELMTPFWPGALTIILQAKAEKVPSLVMGGGRTVGARIPNHELGLELIEKVGVPLIGTSANFHGERTPYEISDLNSDLVQLVDEVVSGGCTIKRESTVVDSTVKPWRILRHGAVELPNFNN